MISTRYRTLSTTQNRFTTTVPKRLYISNSSRPGVYTRTHKFTTAATPMRSRPLHSQPNPEEQPVRMRRHTVRKPRTVIRSESRRAGYHTCSLDTPTHWESGPVHPDHRCSSQTAMNQLQLNEGATLLTVDIKLPSPFWSPLLSQYMAPPRPISLTICAFMAITCGVS